MNSDCIINRRCFQDIKNILDKPYVGFINLNQGFQAHKQHIEYNGTKFNLYYGIGGGDAIAFRRDVWEHINGFDSDVMTGCADTPFMYKSWKHGYFRAFMVGEICVRNLSRELEYNKDSVVVGGVKELSYPKLFMIDNYDRLCTERRNYCIDYFNRVQNEEASIGNMTYWNDYSDKLFPVKNEIKSINWEAGEKHGQNKWKEIILSENIIEI